MQALNNITQNYAKRSSNLLAIHSYEPFSKSLAKIVASTVRPVSNALEMANLIGRTSHSNLRIVPNSFRKIESADLTSTSNIYTGFVRPGSQTLSYDRVLASSQFVEVARNILMDTKDESLWDLKETSKGKILARQESEDIQAMLEVATVRNVSAPRVNAISLKADIGDYIAYVNAETANINFGHVLKYGSKTDSDSVVVMNRQKREFRHVPGDAIIEVASFDMDRNPNISMEEYYAEMYQHNADYYERLENIINNHAVA